MGWTSYHATCFKSNGSIDRKAECDREFSDNEFAIIKSSMVGSVYYAAAKRIGTDEVTAFIVLTSVDGNFFFYKEMTEMCLPYDCKCPKSILKLLAPTENEYANEWRKNCMEYHEKQKSPKLFKNMPVGTRVLWTVASNLWSGGVEQGDKIVLTKIKKSYSNRYVWMLDDGRIINPKNIGMNEYEII